MKYLFFVILLVSFTQCQSQVEYNRECSNAPATKRGDQWGTLFWNQEIRIPFIYEKMEGIRGSGAYIAYLNNKAGVIDCDGKEIIPFDYAYIKNWLQPFGGQHGLYIVTKKKQTMFGLDDNRKEVLNDWGMINENNKVIVPLEYGYLRVIDEDLLVARKDRDTILHFFSGEGKPLFTTPGKKVMKGFNDNTILIDKFKGAQDVMIYKSGKDVLPAQYGRCLWTDKTHSIVLKDQKTIIIDKEGRQISPNNMINFDHNKENEFFFSYKDSVEKQRGVFRLGEGVIIEPQYFLDYWGKVYLAYDEKGINMEVLDFNGNQVLKPQKYWTSRSRNKITVDYKDDYKSSFDDYYMTIEDQSAHLKGLINKKGEVILPLKYRTIVNAWKEHAIFATTENDVFAFDQNGKQILTKGMTNFEHTSDPNILIVELKGEQKKGICYLDQPDAVSYEFKELFNVSKNCLAAKFLESKDYHIVDLKGNRIGNGTFSGIRQPNYLNYERFVRTPEAKGDLIAIGIINQEEYGINKKGETFKLVK